MSFNLPRQACITDLPIWVYGYLVLGFGRYLACFARNPKLKAQPDKIFSHGVQLKQSFLLRILHEITYWNTNPAILRLLGRGNFTKILSEHIFFKGFPFCQNLYFAHYVNNMECWWGYRNKRGVEWAQLIAEHDQRVRDTNWSHNTSYVGNIFVEFYLFVSGAA